MKQKEVINTGDGSRLGYISDIEIDLKEGKIVQLIVPGPGRVLGLFGKDMEYQIPWDKIIKIGEDIILVDLEMNKSLVESSY